MPTGDEVPEPVVDPAGSWVVTAPVGEVSAVGGMVTVKYKQQQQHFLKRHIMLLYSHISCEVRTVGITN